MKSYVSVTFLLITLSLFYLVSKPTLAETLPTDCSKVVVPDQPIKGEIEGISFIPKFIEFHKLGRQEIFGKSFDAYKLSLQNADDNSTLSTANIKFIVPSGKLPDGKVFRYLAGKKFNEQPSFIRGVPEIQGWWLEYRDKKVKFDSIFDQTSIQLNFDKHKEQKINGKIYLCVVDQENKKNSYIAGKFTAAITP